MMDQVYAITSSMLIPLSEPQQGSNLILREAVLNQSFRFRNSIMLQAWGVGTLRLVNRAGILYPGRPGLALVQEELAQLTNPEGKRGGLTYVVW